MKKKVGGYYFLWILQSVSEVSWDFFRSDDATEVDTHATNAFFLSDHATEGQHDPLTRPESRNDSAMLHKDWFVFVSSDNYRIKYNIHLFLLIIVIL